MKKFICIVLSFMLTLTLCSCGNKGEGIPFEECAGYATGTWVDPLGHTGDIVINEDKTADFMGENLTWKVTYSNKNDPKLETDTAWFIVDFLDGDTLKYDVAFSYEEDPGLWISTSINYYDEEGNAHDLDDGTGWYYRVNTETTEIVKITLDNWDKYFSAGQFFDWEDTTDIYDWSFDEYIILNPEYEPRAVETNYNLGVYFEFLASPYHYTLDAENADIKWTEPYDAPMETLLEEVYFNIYKDDYRYKEGYLVLERIHIDRNFGNTDYINLLDYMTIHDANGTLLLKK